MAWPAWWASTASTRTHLPTCFLAIHLYTRRVVVGMVPTNLVVGMHYSTTPLRYKRLDGRDPPYRPRGARSFCGQAVHAAGHHQARLAPRHPQLRGSTGAAGGRQRAMGRCMHLTWMAPCVTHPLRPSPLSQRPTLPFHQATSSTVHSSAFSCTLPGLRGRQQSTGHGARRSTGR